MTYNLAQPFYLQMEEHPGNAALRLDGETFSYLDLARRAQGVANWLRSATARQPERIAIVGGRTWESYAALLGICWSGAAYVPFSPKLPAARLRQVFDLIRPDAVLVDAEGAGALQQIDNGTLPPAMAVARIPSAAKAGAPPLRRAGDPAYILFTSGSTGVPKGVVISCGGVACFLDAMNGRYPLAPEDRVAQPCDLSFDISVSNIFTAWSAGASVCVVPASQSMAPRDFLRREEITIWFSTPSVAVFLDQMKMLRPGAFPSMRIAMFGGEGLPGATAEKWVAATPNGSLENVYGPTETTVACTSVKYTGPETVTPSRGIVAIGTAFAGTELRVTGEDGREMPTGEAGELLIGGAQVGIGYWNDPVQTAAKFPEIDGKRWYRSGDVVYRDANGLFHFLNRVDNQIKLRGFRVELDEIEAHLREVCSSDSAVALAWPVRAGSAAGIVAFVSGAAPPVSQIRNALQDRLPAHMIPQEIRAMDALPVGSTGKFDRRALAALLEKEGR